MKRVLSCSFTFFLCVQGWLFSILCITANTACEVDQGKNLWIAYQELEDSISSSQENLVDIMLPLYEVEYIMEQASSKLDDLFDKLEEVTAIIEDVSENVLEMSDSLSFLDVVLDDTMDLHDDTIDHVEPVVSLLDHAIEQLWQDLSDLDVISLALRQTHQSTIDIASVLDDFEERFLQLKQDAHIMDDQVSLIEEIIIPFSEDLTSFADNAIERAVFVEEALELGELEHSWIEKIVDQTSDVSYKQRLIKRRIKTYKDLVHDTNTSVLDVVENLSRLDLFDVAFEDKQDSVHDLASVIEDIIEHIADVNVRITMATDYVTSFIDITESDIDFVNSAYDELKLVVQDIEDSVTIIDAHKEQARTHFDQAISLHDHVITTEERVKSVLDAVAPRVTLIHDNAQALLDLDLEEVSLTEQLSSEFDDFALQIDLTNDAVEDLSIQMSSIESLIDEATPIFQELCLQLSQTDQAAQLLASQADQVNISYSFIDEQISELDVQVSSVVDNVCLYKSLIETIEDSLFLIDNDLNAIDDHLLLTHSIAAHLVEIDREIRPELAELVAFVRDYSVSVADHFLTDVIHLESRYNTLIEQLMSIDDTYMTALELSPLVSSQLEEVASALEPLVIANDNMDRVGSVIDGLQLVTDGLFDVVRTLPLLTHCIFEQVGELDKLSSKTDPLVHRFFGQSEQYLHDVSRFEKIIGEIHSQVELIHLLTDDSLAKNESTIETLETVEDIMSETAHTWDHASEYAQKTRDMIQEFPINVLMPPLRASNRLLPQINDAAKQAKVRAHTFLDRAEQFDKTVTRILRRVGDVSDTMGSVLDILDDTPQLLFTAQNMEDLSQDLDYDVIKLLEDTEDLLETTGVFESAIDILSSLNDVSLSSFDAHEINLELVLGALNSMQLARFDILADTQEIESTLDEFVISHADTILDNVCDIVTQVENLLPLFSQLESATDALTSTYEQFISKADILHSSSESLQEAVQTVESDFNALISEFVGIDDVVSDSLSSFDVIEENVIAARSSMDISQSLIASMADNIADVFSIIDGVSAQVSLIESLADMLASSADSLLEQTCTLLSVTEILEQQAIDLGDSSHFVRTTFEGTLSKIETIETTVDQIQDNLSAIDSALPVLQSDAEVIESNIDLLLSSCSRVITSADIPFVINERGTYCLGESISLAAGTAIEILNTGCVVLDLHGYTIQSDPAMGVGNNGISVNGSSNVIVRNGTVRDGENGIIIQNSSNDVTVRNMNIDGSATGITIQDSANIIVRQTDSANNSVSSMNVINSSTVLFKEVISRNATQGFVIDVDSQLNCINHSKVIESVMGGFVDAGMSTLVLASIVQSAGTQAYSFSGSMYAVWDSIAISSQQGYLLNGTNGVVRNSIAINNDIGIEIGGAATSNGALGNYVVGLDATTSIGITNNGTDSGIFNNLVHNCVSNYAGAPGVNPATIEFVVTTSSGFWANVSQ